MAVAELTADASWAPQCQARRGQGLRLLQAAVSAHHWHADALGLLTRNTRTTPPALALMLSRVRHLCPVWRLGAWRLTALCVSAGARTDYYSPSQEDLSSLLM